MANYVKAVDFASKDALLSGDPGKVIKGTEIDTEYNSIAVAISTKADLVSPVFTGTPTAPTASPGTNNSQIANTAFVSAAVASGISGAGLGTIATQDTNNVSITGGSITGITDLAVADGGTGSSSLTANAVLLGNGTSAIQTVAPGTTGNVLLSNGTTWTSGQLPLNIQTFNENGTWTKPGAGKLARIQVWGGGGSGGRNSFVGGSGGGGGGYNEIVVDLTTLGATETVTIGAGGAGVSSNGNGLTGGNSSFGSHCTAYGGGGGFGATSALGTGGSGGGALSAGSTGQAFPNLSFTFVAGGTDQNASNEVRFAAKNTLAPIQGGNGGGGTPSFRAQGSRTSGETTYYSAGNFLRDDFAWGGGAGGSGNGGSDTSETGQPAIWGGGGGGSGDSGAAGGLSVYGGAGGAAATNSSANGSNGVAPGGGGGSSEDGTSGAGADGRVVVTVF